MSTNIKMRHFCGAIKCSWVSLIMVAMLFGVCFLLSGCYFSRNNSSISFLVGIVASIIASVIYNVSTRYLRSCIAYLWILDQTEILITYIESCQCSYYDNDFKLKIWNYIVYMRERAQELTYKKDFNTLSVKFSEIIDALYKNDKQKLCNTLSELIKEKNKITK